MAERPGSLHSRPVQVSDVFKYFDRTLFCNLQLKRAEKAGNEGDNVFQPPGRWHIGRVKRPLGRDRKTDSRSLLAGGILPTHPSKAKPTQKAVSVGASVPL